MTNVIFTQFGNIIWTYFFLPALFIAAIFLTTGCKALQVKKFGFVIRETIGKAFIKSSKSKKGVSPFQASSTALGSTVGTGNIVGTAQAITMGGPGALFWLWIAALISMIVKYAEILLAIHFRKSMPGYGPMDYIHYGIKSKNLASIYAFLALLSSLAMGNICQSGSITDAVTSAMANIFKSPAFYAISARLSVGLAITALTLLLLSGGAKRIAKCAELLVPFMVILFISVSLSVIIKNLNSIPSVFSTVFKEAFKPGSISGGIAGVSTAKCIQWGFRRSAFSNEAGLGTSALAHTSADTEEAARQALWGIFEVFTDSIVICSCTSLCILCSGIQIPWGKLVGSGLFLEAISTVLGKNLSSILLAFFIGIFAYTSIMGWALYGTRCSAYLFGEKYNFLYCIIYCMLLLVGSIMPLQSIWQISDTINALMSIPNLIAVIILSPTVSKISRDSFS